MSIAFQHTKCCLDKGWMPISLVNSELNVNPLQKGSSCPLAHLAFCIMYQIELHTKLLHRGLWLAFIDPASSGPDPLDRCHRQHPVTELSMPEQEPQQNNVVFDWLQSVPKLYVCFHLMILWLFVLFHCSNNHIKS